MDCDYCQEPEPPIYRLVEKDEDGNPTGKITDVCHECYYSGVELIFHIHVEAY